MIMLKLGWLWSIRKIIDFKKKKKTENFVTADMKTFEKIPKHWQARDVIKKNK